MNGRGRSDLTPERKLLDPGDRMWGRVRRTRAIFEVRIDLFFNMWSEFWQIQKKK